MITTSIFQNESSQAVRIPKELRFEGDRVRVKKIGNYVVLMPVVTSWQPLLGVLGEFPGNFLPKRNQPEQQKREELFK